MLRRAAPFIAALFVLAVPGCQPAPLEDLDASTIDAAGSCSAADECDDGLFCNGPERCDPSSRAANDRGCVPASPPCPASECDETADRCTGACGTRDADGDGATSYACGGVDCDDEDASRHPGALEVCDPDGRDEDCDPATFGDVDADGDGAFDATCCNGPVGGARCGTDCDDTSPGVSPRATETCNGDDDDCDGAIDERVQTTLWPDVDGDGFGADDESSIPRLACSTIAGWAILRGDCDDATPGRNPGVPDVCNGTDDDCDGLVDDVVSGVVSCIAGSTRPCVTACGIDGTAACRADCLGFEACVGVEACNGCDDDADGTRDEDFACERGFPVGCTTACGTRGTQQCTRTCTLESCVAPEICNYCDDDGVNGYADERALAIDVESRYAIRGGGSTAGVAVASALMSGSGYQIYVDLLDGATVDQAGAYWLDLAKYVGWGPVRIEVTLQARVLDGGWPFGGWSVVVANGGSGTIGTPADFGVPRTVDGVRFDWHWGRPDTSTGMPLSSDSMGYRAMLAGGFAVRGNTRFTFGDGLSDIVDSSPMADLDAGSTTFVTQPVIIDYQPENPFTATREEIVRVTMNGRTVTYAPDDDMNTNDPSNDLPVGSRIRLGFTAGSYTYVYRPSGGPATTLGARVQARVVLTSFVPPSGPGSPTYNDRVLLSRAQFCPEL